MKIVVTGHMGLVGTELTKHLDEYVGIDLKNSQDILFTKLPEADVIIHLAAQTSVPNSIKDPEYDALDNIIGTIKILTENPNAKIIFASSVAIKDPLSPYGVSKLACEHYARILHDNCVVLRFPNVFSNTGEGVISKFINDEIVTVHGDGTQVRDFVHIDDIVRGILMAFDWDSGLYEMGSGTGYRVIDLANATGKEIKFGPKRAGDIHESICENTTPDWKPTHEPINFIKLQSKRDII